MNAVAWADLPEEALLELKISALGLALPGTVALLVGPEGGWTDREREQAQAAGWSAVSLGPLVLRAETAATAALALVMGAWLA
jgi:16S rRNA (uracil1498-N3)-methyltransferase